MQNIDELLFKIKKDNFTYRTLLFSNALFRSYLDKEHLNDSIPHDFHLRAFDNSTHGLEIKGRGVVKEVEFFGQIIGVDYKTASDNIVLDHSAFVRRIILIIVYESVDNFHKLYPNKKLKIQLQQTDWFRMLHVLRNLAAHTYFGIAVDFPKGYPSPVVWRNLSVTKGQVEDNVMYTDLDILTLIATLIEWIEINKKEFD